MIAHNMDSFKGKKVLITGHTGFKGSWLTLWLNMLGAKVTGVALDPEQEKGAFLAMEISSVCNDIRQNINDLKAIQSIFLEHQPEIVFHLAAQPLVIDSYSRPIETLQTNIIGTANILEACRHTPSVNTIIVITTDKCYENRETLKGYTETDRLLGKDPYSASKAAAEIVVYSFRESFFKQNQSIGLATARAGNVIGGGDWADNRILPDCIRSLIENKPIEVRNPNAVRPWQHVLEPLGGYLLLASKLMHEPQKYSEPWNFGPEEESVKTVGDLVNEVIKAWGSGKWSTHQLPNDSPDGFPIPIGRGSQLFNHYKEAKLLTLNIDKAKTKLSWKPLLSFNQSITQSVSWYKAQFEGKNMADFSKNQISEYQKLFKW